MRGGMNWPFRCFEDFFFLKDCFEEKEVGGVDGVASV